MRYQEALDTQHRFLMRMILIYENGTPQMLASRKISQAYAADASRMAPRYIRGTASPISVPGDSFLRYKITSASRRSMLPPPLPTVTHSTEPEFPSPISDSGISNVKRIVVRQCRFSEVSKRGRQICRQDRGF
jgi:hypothetical protein